MSYQNFTVMLTDLATYRINVAACSADEAKSIAKTVLHVEATTLPDGMTIVTRETDATAEPAQDASLRPYRVHGTYKLDFSMTLPAACARDAEVHARRLYDENCGPYEFEVGDERVGPFTAGEMRS
ncbi:MAG: hypothetical protein ABL907_20835 [Hyphomicrobium sp.]